MRPINQNQLFSGIEAASVENLLLRGQWDDYPMDHLVFAEGDPGDRLYLIETGSIAISKLAEEGHEEQLSKMGEGDYFGEMAIFDGKPRSANARALTPVRLWSVGTSDFETILASNPGMVMNLFRNIIARLRSMDEHFIEELVKRERMAIVGRMAGSIIHDVRNPLATIRRAGEILNLSNDSSVQQISNMIVLQVDRLAGMTRDLLDFSRGQPVLNRARVTLSSIIDGFLALAAHDYASRNISIVQSLEYSGDVEVDSGRMIRVYYNICGNAADAMPNGGRLTLGSRVIQNKLQLSIADTGDGIPEAIRPNVFKPFFTSGKMHGTGLGMSITKKIIEDHGGNIWFHSTIGQGTTFYIDLDLPTSQEPANNARSK
jgi:signal transduction histidine kinase